MNEMQNKQDAVPLAQQNPSAGSAPSDNGTNIDPISELPPGVITSRRVVIPPNAKRLAQQKALASHPPTESTSLLATVENTDNAVQLESNLAEPTVATQQTTPAPTTTVAPPSRPESGEPTRQSAETRVTPAQVPPRRNISPLVLVAIAVLFVIGAIALIALFLFPNLFAR